MTRHILSALTLAALSATGAQAQTVLNAAGGTAAISGNTYEYSIGEMTIVTTNTAGSITVTHGVLQPTNKPNSIAPQPWLATALNVYPNPALDEVFIKPSLPAASLLTYSLVDATGKLVRAAATATLHTGGEQQRVSLSALAAGTYLLMVEATQPNGRKASEAFKINKLR